MAVTQWSLRSLCSSRDRNARRGAPSEDPPRRGCRALSRKETKSVGEPGNSTVVVELDAEQLRELSAVFSSPRWLRDLGIAAWLLVGVAALLVGLTWIAGLTSTIMEPVLVGLVVATVASPAREPAPAPPRAARGGAGLVLLLLIALGAVIVLLVVGGVRGEAGTITAQASARSDKFQGWLEDARRQRVGSLRGVRQSRRLRFPT